MAASSSSYEARTIMERLHLLGFPRQPRDLVAYVKENDVDMQLLIAALFPNEGIVTGDDALQKMFQESVMWLKWLVFKVDPGTFPVVNYGEKGVCGTVLGLMQMKYRCITCELDSKCAICVDCFERRGHCEEDHEYRFMFSAGGSCDCGDIVSMKPSGFCSLHKGNEHIQALPSEFASSMRSVLSALFKLWKDTLLTQRRDVQKKLTSSVVELLLEFCGQSKSLGSLISEILFSLPDLLKILVKVEQFLPIHIFKRLHELLLKLLMLGELRYQHGFAKVFIHYYPTVVDISINKKKDGVLETYPLLRSVSLQIFTRPALTLKLVKEDSLLRMLVSGLNAIFKSCQDADGWLEITKWKGLYKTTIRMVENIEFVMRHSDVQKHVIRQQKYIITMWMQILRCYVQEMNPQLRETSIYIGDEPFVLGHCLAQIRSHLVGGAISEDVEELQDPDSVRPAKLPRISLSGTSKAADIPSSVSWLTAECLKTIDSWLVASFGQETGGSGSGSNDLKVLSLREWTEPIISQDISVHIPLHRLLSMVLQGFLRKCYDHSAFLNATSGWLPTTTSDDLFSSILRGCHPHGFSASIMEHPLRIRVFCAQVRAGMLKRYKYGDAAISCREYYLHESWYENGLELDLFLLQCCAAFAPEPDRYVKRILERYGLSEYLNLNCPEGSTEYEPVLVEEMLKLMIQIIQERRFCGGLTTAECLRREIVHKLSVADACYSELMGSIPKDLLENVDFKKILHSVAVYTSPVDLKPGMFKLQSEYLKELNLYHLRWEAKDLQKAEEKYFRDCEVSALTAQLPSWSKTYPPLSGIHRIATCKTTLEIVRIVLFYALKSPPRAPEVVVLAAMHMLSIALDICSQLRASGQSEATPILEFASEEISASGNASESLLSLLVSLMRREKGAVDFDLFSLCINTLKKFKELEPHKISAQVGNELSDGSMLASNRGKGKAKQAAALEKLKAQQGQFAKCMVTDDASTSEDLEAKNGEDECALCRGAEQKSPMCIIVHLQKSRLLSLLDRGRIDWESSSASPRSATSTPLPTSSDSSHLVQSATGRFAQILENAKGRFATRQILTSTRRGESSDAGETQERSSQSVLLQRYLASIVEERPCTEQPSRAYDGVSPPGCDGVYISSCGHSVHQRCLGRSILSREREDSKEHIVDSAKVEFPCPVCRGIANSILPTLARDSNGSETASDPGIFSSSSSTGEYNLQISEAVSLLHDAAVGIQDPTSSIPFKQPKWQKSLEPVFHTLGSLYSPYMGKAFETGRVNHSLLLWDILRYSIASTEIAARSDKRLKLSGSILSVLVKTVQRFKLKSRPTTFLRQRGIQLIEESLCSGSSNDECKRQEVDKLMSLEKSDSEANFPDVQFWKMASDPVLALDSFSSLMWTLFCLPSSFLSSEKDFLSLVHIFYLVTITQAIVICCRKQKGKVSQLHKSLITDISDVILNHFHPFEIIDSNRVQASDDIMETISSLSIPFLRRCSLLWQLVKSTEATVENDSLESMFRIPSLDIVINDDQSRSSAKLWLNNFLKDYKSRQGIVLYCTPSDPFELLALPKYEELLKRYNNQGCPYCSSFLENPALCLICGKLCESKSKSCCSEVNCKTHAMACGAGTVVFLMIQKTSTLLQSADQNAGWHSLYLNEFGEEDIDFLRGRPLFLSEARYHHLNHMVASHGLESEVFQSKLRPEDVLAEVGEEDNLDSDDDDAYNIYIQ